MALGATLFLEAARNRLRKQFQSPIMGSRSERHPPPMPLMYPAFSASAFSSPYYRFSDTASTLTLWGKFVGQVTALGDPILFYTHPSTQVFPPSPEAEADAVLATFKQWSSLAHSLPAYPNGQPIPEAFACTLCTNGIYDNIRGLAGS